MKKTLISLAMLLSLNRFAETYKLTVISKHIDAKSIAIKDTDGNVVNEPLTCTLPEVLNQAGDACEILTPVCEDPLILNEAGDACINPIENVGWIHLEDSCGKMRQSNFHPNVYFARARTNDTNTNLEIPAEYHWVSKSEYTNLFNSSTVSTKNNSINPYANQCGVSEYPIYNGQQQYVFLFKSGGTSGMHSGNYEYHGVSHQNYNSGVHFAGYVLYKDN